MEIVFLKNKIYWNEKNNNLLLKAINYNKSNNWVNIANYFNRFSEIKRSEDQWKYIHKLYNEKITNKNWTKEEVNLLISKILEHGNSWSKIKNYFKNRTYTDLKKKFYNILIYTIKLISKIIDSKYLNVILKKIKSKNLSDFFIINYNYLNELSIQMFENKYIIQSEFLNKILNDIYIKKEKINSFIKNLDFKMKFKKLIISISKFQFQQHISNISNINNMKEKYLENNYNIWKQYKTFSTFIENIQVSDLINLKIFKKKKYQKHINEIRCNFLNLRYNCIKDLYNQQDN